MDAPNSPITHQVLGRIAPTLDALIPGGRVLAAVSGGADSLALLQVLVASGREVCVAHINHQMRGEESEGDEAHVRQVCARLGVPFEARRVQVLGDANMEARARDRRYEALGEVARECDCRFVATGHTASDSLETILMFWLRGATISGLRGIEPSRALQVLEGNPISVVRPLLEVSRAECEAICRKRIYNGARIRPTCSPST
jgi:tRNA(Ile)-lysidine synthase